MMRKICMILAAAMAAGFLSLAAPVAAEPSDACSNGEVPGVVATGTDGDTSVSVCAEGIGSLTAAQKGDGGYVVADGDSSNPDVTAGYIGVSDKGPLVCDGSGTYSYSGPNECNPV